MQTFVPLLTYEGCARVLDNRRLGKQRVEVFQILRTLLGHTSGWRNHPAVRMWAGAERCLGLYGMFVCSEWIRRGFGDSMLPRIEELYCASPVPTFTQSKPIWWGGKIHLTHKAALMRKNPEWYGRFGWMVDPTTPYYWPQ